MFTLIVWKITLLNMFENYLTQIHLQMDTK